MQLLVAFVLNNWWEEVAWAGFVGVRLQERFGSTLRASLVAGPLFALQHVSGVVGNDLVTALVLLVVLAVLVTPFRMLAGWAVNRTGSVFAVGLLHAAADAAGPGSGFGPGCPRPPLPGHGPRRHGPHRRDRAGRARRARRHPRPARTARRRADPLSRPTRP